MPVGQGYLQQRTSIFCERHEVFFGPNRQKSIKDGLVVFLTPEMHRSTIGVHGKSGHDFDLYLKKLAQKRWQEYYNKTTEDFIKEYGKNYLDNQGLDKSLIPYIVRKEKAMKDPAFLFYSSDFLSGTMLMTDEEVGQYIKLLCLQHQKGHLKEKDMLNICKSYNEDIFSKFKKDEEGNYYNERLEYESNKRKAYSESRRNNRKKKETYEEDMKNICNSYEEHMGNENVIVNENININKNNRKRGYKGEKEEVSDSCVDGLQEIINFYNENIGMITPYRD